MKELLETKNAVVAAVPANSTLVLLAAVIDGTPTAAQIETARYAVEANLENVGATATSAYLTRFEPVELNADENLLLTVDATLSKVAPNPLSDAEAEPLDETSSTETASSEGVASNGNDATSSGDESAAESQTSEA